MRYPPLMEEQVKYYFGDREVLFKRPTDGQLAAITKYVTMGQRRPDYMVRAVGRILEVIDNLVVNDDDREFLEDELIAGRLSAQELITPLANLMNDSEEEDTKTRKPRARRGA